ncbi:histidine kinase [Paucibacter sediminis]|uniref:Histidine kinase n=1 Tax=Paucibacter sediminis TaxID=3019553 RepID=A0AA95SW74_9BURK|nr:histidine kinase [Paucibacter sp. S2-9]WIT11959.1 histidine kinase [Paucibacter sp. S2-9]
MRSVYLLLLRPAALLGLLAACALLGGLLAGALVWLAGWGWAAALGATLPLVLFYALLLPSAWELSRALPLARGRAWQGLARYAVAALLVGGLCTLLAWAWLEPAAPLAASLFALASGGYLLALLAADALQAWAGLRDAEHRAEQAQARAVEAELLMLRNQVNPHFLFNCLNSISALTSFDAAAARRMTLALAQYFRQTLALTQRDWITLDEELIHCRGYVEIEQVRFGERLRFDCELADGAGAALLPPMLLQPLVENAVKHGIAARSEGGTLSLRALRQGDWLHVQLSNPLANPLALAAAASPHELGTGTGLHNVRQRLLSLFAGRANLRLRSEAGQFVAEITLPWRSEP